MLLLLYINTNNIIFKHSWQRHLHLTLFIYIYSSILSMYVLLYLLYISRLLTTSQNETFQYMHVLSLAQVLNYLLVLQHSVLLDCL